MAGVAADKNVIPKYVSAQATEISKQELNTPQAAKEKCQLNIIKYIPFDWGQGFEKGQGQVRREIVVKH